MPDEASLQRIVDRQSIIDCLLRYARGVDRGDYEMMASAYHEDAVEDHGFFVGRGKELVKWSAAFRKDNPDLNILRHLISNHYMEFDGPDCAHVETHYTVDAILPGETPLLRTSLGRYVDRFERRGGEWKIAARICTLEASGECAYVPMDEKSNFAKGSRDKTDVSYMRPLTVTRPLTESS